jgi:hypothetical protein
MMLYVVQGNMSLDTKALSALWRENGRLRTDQQSIGIIIIASMHM